MKLPIRVEGIIFSKNKNKIEYLLLKRTRIDGGFWQPMTGTLNDGEYLKDCLVRELEEETGIKEHINIIENVDMFEWKDSKEKTITEYVFGIQVKKTKIELSYEHDEFGWYPFEDAVKRLEKKNNVRSLKILNDILTRGDRQWMENSLS